MNKLKDTKKVIRVIETETGAVIKEIDVSYKTERAIDRLDSGINRNLDHNKFHTLVTIIKV